MHNITESLTFLAFARETLAEVVTKDESRDFILNEATDYEVLSALVTGKFPEVREDVEKESALMDSLKKFVLDNKNTLSTFLGPTAVSTFILEIDIVSPYKLSSSFKFIEESLIPKGEVITEVDWKRVKGSMGKSWERTKDQAKVLGKGYVDTAKKAGGKVAGVAKAGATKVSTNVKVAKEFVKKTTTGKVVAGIGALALAAMASYAAHKIYQRYFSQFAKQCKGATDKKGCIKHARATALKAKATTLKSAMSTCSKSKEPDKCKSAIQGKIGQVEEKLAKAITK